MLNVGDYAVTIAVETAISNRFVITYGVKNRGVEDVGVFRFELQMYLGHTSHLYVVPNNGSA
jgi:hypothetical protein